MLTSPFNDAHTLGTSYFSSIMCTDPLAQLKYLQIPCAKGVRRVLIVALPVLKLGGTISMKIWSTNHNYQC